MGEKTARRSGMKVGFWNKREESRTGEDSRTGVFCMTCRQKLIDGVGLQAIWRYQAEKISQKEVGR